MTAKFKYEKLTGTIINTFYEVYNYLGYGFLESVYENALKFRLMDRDLEVKQQFPIPVYDEKRRQIGDFRADLYVENKVLLELKTAREISDIHKAQLLNYLKATNIEVGLLLNFGPEAKFRRLLFTNDKK